MCAPTAVMTLLSIWRRVDFMRYGCSRGDPVVAGFLHLPGLWFAALQPGVGTRISGTAETDFVPGPGMSVVGVNGVSS